MITIVIPTRNRAYTLKSVLESYYTQRFVDQIVIVDDCSDDETKSVVDAIANRYSIIETTYMKNSERRGASFSRNAGVEKAKNAHILFGEDDAFLEGNYAEALLSRFEAGDVDIISGRLINLYPDEKPEDGINRFGHGDSKKHNPFNFLRFAHVPDAYFEEEVQIPLTHALILTTKDLLKKFPFDPFYSQGNGFREESDFQMNAYVNGKVIVTTNATHCMHLHPENVGQGGQRSSPLKRLWYSYYYTNYFLKKYYAALKRRGSVQYPRQMAMFFYLCSLFAEYGNAFMLSFRKKLQRGFNVEVGD